MSNLKRKAVNSVIWTTIRTLFGIVAMPMLLIMKARYLSPTEFGVLSILNIFMAVINVIENTGLNKAVIQKKNITENEKSSLFNFQIFFGIVLGFLMIVFAPLVASIFDMPSISRLLPVMSLTILISSPLLILSSFLEKELMFKQLSLIEMARNTALLISTFLFFVIFDFSLLGVILGQVISAIIGFTLVWIVTKKYKLFSMRLWFKFSDVLPFLKFGFSVVGREILAQLTSRLDEVIIGLFLSAETLGYYYFAKNTLSQMRSTISGALSKVLFPLLSKVNDNPGKLRNLNSKLSKYIGIIAFPMFIGLVTTSHLFIPLLFGEEWIRSNNIFILLAIASIPNFISGNLSNTFLYTINKPNTVLSIELIVNGVYIFALFIVSWLNIGIYAVIFTYTVYIILRPIIAQLVVNKILNINLMNYIATFKASSFSAIIMAFIVIITQYITGFFVIDWLVLIISIIVGIILYASLYYLIDKKTIIELKSLILN